MRRLAIIAVMAVLPLCGCSEKTPQPGEEKWVVGPETLRDVISQTGEVAPVVKVDIKCEASGSIDKVFVKEGEQMQKGDKILIIDPSRLKISKEKLDLQVEQARIEREQALRSLNRGKELAATGSVSNKQLEDLQSAFDLRDIALRQRIIERRDIADQLAKTTVVAPMTGVLTALDVEEGEIAISATSGFQAGTTIGTIADITNLEVITQIGEADYTRLRKGQSVVVRPEAGDGIQTRGTISFISLSARKRGGDELGTFEVRISIDSLIIGIVPGVNVHVEFVVLEKQVPMVVPYHFVQRRGRAYTIQVRPGPGAPVAQRPARESDPTDSSGTKRERRKREGAGRGENGGAPAVAKRGPDAKQDASSQVRTPGKMTTVDITVGETDYRNYEVTGGLAEGDTVVYTPPKVDKNATPGSQRGATGGRR